MIQVTWYQLIILVGFIQSIILIFLLIFKQENRKSNFLLAALLLVIGRSDLSSLSSQFSLSQYPYLLPLFYDFLLVLSPILYFYIRSLTQASFRFNRVFWFYIGLALCLDLAGDYTLQWCRETKNCSRAWLITFAEIYSLITVILFGVILVLSVKILRKYDRSLKDHFTNLDKINLHWLQTLLKTIGVVAIYWILLVIVDVFLFNYRINNTFYDVLNVWVVVIVYWIGFSQYVRPRVVIVEEILVPVPNNEKQKAPIAPALAEAEMQRYAQMLQTAMQQDQLYLDATLNLNALAKHLDIPAKHISQTLNQHVGKNLNDFVNEYRVEEVKQKLVDPQFAHLTILGIAFESGFNSKASFQRTFKKVVECSPSEYKKRQNTGLTA